MKLLIGAGMAVVVGGTVAANIARMFGEFLNTFHAALGL